MGEIRTVKETFRAKPTKEGAGVRLKRAFGFYQVPKLDPFLLLDDFHTEDPDDYIRGFPWHPHRGIETVSYILNGSIEHGDSLGNTGTISGGDVQWMTAGSGIVHQEMPEGDENGHLWGLQLWINLPKKNKLMTPRYQEIQSKDIPETILENKVTIKIIAGTLNGVNGPVQDIIINPLYVDVSVPANLSFTHKIEPDHTLFAYILSGKGQFQPDTNEIYEPETVVIFSPGDHIQITAADEDLRFLLIGGMPIKEPVAWHGPIVMNTDEELETAFQEYLTGNFIKNKSSNGFQHIPHR